MIRSAWGRCYEWLFRHALYPLYEQRLRGRQTLALMEEIAERDQWDSARLAAYQLAQLKRLLRHAHDQVPWYRESIARVGLVPEDMTSVSQLSVLPVLDKQTVRENYDAMIAESYRGKTFSKVTGGSTGEPFRFEITREDYERRMAVMWRGYARAGARMGRRTLYLWGADILPGKSLPALKNRAYHAFFQRRMLNSFTLTEDNQADYVHQIRRWQPEVLVAYVSPLYQLARYMLSRNVRLNGLSAILTGAEPLHGYQREAIEAAFSAPVYNTYGCREVMLLASECPGVDGLLMNADQFVLESIDETGHGVTESPGELLITDLHAYGMPLIRYRNGDRVVLSNAGCPSSEYPWPLMRSVEGRQLDVIRTVDGRLLPGEFFPHLLKDIPGVVRFQVRQTALDQLNISLVTDTSHDAEARTLLLTVLRENLGERMEITLLDVDQIPLTRGGKHRVTISELPVESAS